MLQVTFRGLLPSEALLALASEWYGKLPAGGGWDGLCCFITISGHPDSPESLYRVIVDVSHSTRGALGVTGEAIDPCLAVRNCMATLRDALPAMSAPSLVAANRPSPLRRTPSRARVLSHSE